MHAHKGSGLIIRMIRNVPKIIKDSTGESQLLGITGLPCNSGGLVKFEVKISIDPHVHGKVMHMKKMES